MNNFLEILMDDDLVSIDKMISSKNRRIRENTKIK